MKTTAEKIAIMQAYLDGEKLRMKLKDSACWVDVEIEPTWSWNYCDYRLAVKTQELWWAIIRKSNGQFIKTSPKPTEEYKRVLNEYLKSSSKLVCEYSHWK